MTTCSQFVLMIFKEKLIYNLNLPQNEDPFKLINNLNDVHCSINDLCNDWLFEHMWLWAQCKITIEEHHIQNLERVYIGKIVKTLEEEINYKFNLEHYNNAKEVIQIQNY